MELVFLDVLSLLCVVNNDLNLHKRRAGLAAPHGQL